MLLHDAGDGNHSFNKATVFNFRRKSDNFEARTERVIFGVFQFNSDLTWLNLTLESTDITQQI